jgi:hypothetical protein
VCQYDNGGITTQTWIEHLKNPDTAELSHHWNELGTHTRVIQKRKKGKRRKENI